MKSRADCRQLAVVLALAGWFFAMRAPSADDEGVFVHQLTGPYKSEKQCREKRDEVEASLSEIIKGLQVSKCFERQEL